MRENIKKWAISLFDSAKVLSCYPPGLVIIFLFWLGRKFGRITILHENRLPKSIENMVIPYNHPSVIDHWFIAGLLARFWMRHPLTQSPLISADRKLFYDSKKWYLRIFRHVMHPVDRDEQRRDATSTLKLKNTKRPVMTCPETKRTFKGGQWLYCKNGNDDNGGRIAPFGFSVGNLIQKGGRTVLPIAIVGSHKVVPNDHKKLWTYFNFLGKVTLVVGNPINFDPILTKWEVTRQLEIEILNLISEAI